MQSIRKLISRKLGVYFRHATLAEGLLKGSDLPFRCLFADNTSLTDYMMQMIYSGPPVVIKKWRIYIPSIKKMLKMPSHEIDMYVAVLPAVWESDFDKLSDYKTQEWITQVIDVSEIGANKNHNVSRAFRETSNKIKRHRLSYKITNELSDFREFYDQMYLPLIKKQFGGLADIETYENMLEIFKIGHLLQVLQDGKPIAAALNFVQNGTLTGRRLGVLDGNEEFTKIGVQAAAYYFGIRYGIEQGLKKMDLITSRPFFGDGVYSHKRDWGATVYPCDYMGTWVYLFIPKKSEKIVHFFEKNPILVHGKDGLRGLVGYYTNEFTAEQRKELIRKYHSPGLKGLYLITPSSTIPCEIDFQDEQPSGVLGTP